jgi:WD domain, G-beta repeat
MSINLWDIGSGKLIKSMSGHTSSVHSLTFSAESSILVSGSSDCTVRVWDVEASQGGDSAASQDKSGSAKAVGLSESLSGAGALRRSSGIGLPDGLARLESAKSGGVGSGVHTGSVGRTRFGVHESRPRCVLPLPCLCNLRLHVLNGVACHQCRLARDIVHQRNTRLRCPLHATQSLPRGGTQTGRMRRTTGWEDTTVVRACYLIERNKKNSRCCSRVKLLSPGRKQHLLKIVRSRFQSFPLLRKSITVVGHCTSTVSLGPRASSACSSSRNCLLRASPPPCFWLYVFNADQVPKYASSSSTVQRQLSMMGWWVVRVGPGRSGPGSKANESV